MITVGFVPNKTTGWIDFVSIAEIKCQNNSKLTTVIHHDKINDWKSRGSYHVVNTKVMNV